MLHASFVDKVSEQSESLSAKRVLLMREVCRLKPNDEVLNHVVSVNVSRERKNLWSQLFDDHKQLRVHLIKLSDALVESLNDGLHRARAMLVQ